MTAKHRGEYDKRTRYYIKIFVMAFLFNTILFMGILLGFDYLAAHACHLPFVIKPLSMVIPVGLGIAGGIYAVLQAGFYRRSNKEQESKKEFRL